MTEKLASKEKKTTQESIDDKDKSMSLDEQFQRAAVDVKRLGKRPTDEELLEIYALYKQALMGDIDKEKPALTDIKGAAKWDAWNGKKGMPQERAKQEYISKVNRLIDTYGLQS